jgi:hypothetical protein
MPYGAGTVYNTATGRYEIVGQTGSYADVGSLELALHAAEVASLAAQSPQPTNVMIGPYASYPVPMVRTLPGGIQISEERYQQALREGTLPQVISDYQRMAAFMPGTPQYTGQALTVTAASGPSTPNAPSYQPRVTLTNATRPGQPPQVGDSIRVDIQGGPPNEVVTATATHNSSTSTSEMGRSNAAGAWSTTVRMTPAEVGSWVEHWRVGAWPVSPTLSFTVTAAPAPAPTQYAPTATLTNTTRPGQPPQVGDSIRVDIQGGPPNEAVTVTVTHNGTTSTSEMGRTNAAGAWSTTVRMTAAEVGSWGEHWRVGAWPASPSLSFTVSAAPSIPGTPTTPAEQAPAAGAAGAGGSTGPAVSEIVASITETAAKIPAWGWALAAGAAYLLFRNR